MYNGVFFGSIELAMQVQLLKCQDIAILNEIFVF